MVNLRRFIGQVAAASMGVLAYKAAVAIHNGSHDAVVGLVAVLGVAALVAIAAWGYMGDES